MNTCQQGLRCELVVMADLIKRGWEVYQGHQNSYDILALKKNRVLKIEVKSSQNLTLVRTIQILTPDIIALVNNDNRIRYRATHYEPIRCKKIREKLIVTSVARQMKALEY